MSLEISNVKLSIYCVNALLTCGHERHDDIQISRCNKTLICRQKMWMAAQLRNLYFTSQQIEAPTPFIAFIHIELFEIDLLDGYQRIAREMLCRVHGSGASRTCFVCSRKCTGRAFALEKVFTKSFKYFVVGLIGRETFTFGKFQGTFPSDKNIRQGARALWLMMLCRFRVLR